MTKNRLFYLGFLLVVALKLQATTFIEKSALLNISFKHDDARNGMFQFTETSGSGVAWLDYNNDDLMDLLMLNGIHNKHKLFKNMGGQFKDVSTIIMSPDTKLNPKLRGMGVCSADVNQDGWIDFLISNFGNDILYINKKGREFIPHVLQATQTAKWSTSCAFADLDNDGDVDLYVARYVKYQFNGNESCIQGNNKGYCNPKVYPGEVDGLYINDGRGKFTEVGQDRGINTAGKDRGFGIIISDYDQDQDMDIYVANDGSNNLLYVNNGKGFFEEKGLLSGVAINLDGSTEASMGLALGDINRDGLQDIITSHFSLETNTIYQNDSSGYFADMTQKYGMSKTSFMDMGWGIALLDVNNNGYEDLLVANGHIHDFIKDVDSRQKYKQANQLFLNKQAKKFILQSQDQSFTNIRNKASRGLAVADWNNDGKVDFAVNNINDTVSVYENTDENKNNWLGVKLIGDMTNRSAIGAVVVASVNDSVQRKEVISGGSFMSQSDLRLLFGLGDYEQGVELLVIWPNGKINKYSISDFNKYHTIKYEQD